MNRLYFALIILFLSSASVFAVGDLPKTNPPLATPPNPAAATTPPAPTNNIIAVTQPPIKAEGPSRASRLWNLQDADILSVINEVSLETGKNFVVDPRVNGKISLVSSKPIKPEEVYDIFLSVLELLGYSAVADGNVVKIVPNMESGEYATRVASARSPGKGDEVVVRVIPLENVSAAQIIPSIRPMLPQWSNVSAYTPGNVLIVLARAANIQRIMSVIANIDKASDTNIEVVPLHQASASQLSTVLTNLQNAGRATGEMPQVSVAADERSNSILLSGNHAARLHMRYLISRLDTPSAGSVGNTQVVYLRYLEAKTFAPILGKIAQNIMGKGVGGSSASPTVVNVPSGIATAKSGEPENQTNIQAEPTTNALIITAPPSLMPALTSIISKLDIRPAQVLIEAIVVQINQDDLKNLGIQWGGAAGTNSSGFTPSFGPGFTPPGLGTVGIIPHMQFQAVLSALENIVGANILSTPSVVVLDNRRAILEVGQEVPATSGQYATTGNASTATPFTTTNYKRVALTLDVTPQINLADSVRLKLLVKNDTLQHPDNPGPTPTFNINKISNSVLVNTDDILVVGGLISNSLDESLTKVPILGDVPVVGLLFQQRQSKMEKKNLMVFIKTVILHNAEDANCITNTKYNFVRQQQIDYPDEILRKENQKMQFILPPYKNDVNLPKPFEPPV